MKNFVRKTFKLVRWGAFLFFCLSVFGVVLFRFANPPLTPLMIIRHIEHDQKQGDQKFEYKWVNLEDISKNMILAAVAAEDNKFPTHFGVDFEAIKRARLLNKYSKIKHGGSTITQQTAKNLFLIPSRNFIRKGFELYFTLLIEVFWSKERIMEVYLNIVEMGDGIYGIEAASQIYFHKPSSKLTRGESALLAAALPNPRKRNPAKPSKYMYYYQGRVLGIMNAIGNVKL